MSNAVTHAALAVTIVLLIDVLWQQARLHRKLSEIREQNLRLIQLSEVIERSLARRVATEIAPLMRGRVN